MPPLLSFQSIPHTITAIMSRHHGLALSLGIFCVFIKRDFPLYDISSHAKQSTANNTSNRNNSNSNSNTNNGVIYNVLI